MAKITTLKLNLGCGLDYKQGWVNIDAVAEVEPDLVQDLLQPLPFKNGQASEVLAQDIFEHFTKEDGRAVMAEIARVLVDGGTATFRVPHIDSILEKYQDDKEVRNEFLYGTTKDTGIFGAHKVGFTKESFFELCLSAQLVPVSFAVVDTNMEITCLKKQVIPSHMKLLFFVHTFGLGGAEQFVTDLAVALQQRGYIPVVASNHVPFLNLCKKAGLATFKQHTSIDVIGDWKGLVKSFLLVPKALSEYGKCIRSVQPDLVIAVGFSDKFFTSFFANVLTLPLVWIEFGPLDTVLRKFFYLPKVLYFLVKGVPQKVVVPSQNTLQKLTSVARVSLSKFERIPCGTVIPKLASKQVPKSIVCVSRFAKGKGQELLLRAYAQNVSQLGAFKLIFVGTGETLEGCKQLSATLGISEHVVFLGWVPDSAKVLSQASICVFPSTWDLEGFGLVTIEAMAQGKPVVAFETGPSPEIIEHMKTGILVSQRTAEALGDSLVYVATHQTHAKTMGKAARERAEDMYSIEKCTQDYVAVFERCYARFLATKYEKELTT